MTRPASRQAGVRAGSRTVSRENRISASAT
jgi:hypothetical protein